MSFQLGTFNPAQGYYPGPDYRFSAGHGAPTGPTPKSPSKAVPIKSPPKAENELKGLGLTMGAAAPEVESVHLPPPSSAPTPVSEPAVSSTTTAQLPASTEDATSAENSDATLLKDVSEAPNAQSPQSSNRKPSSTESSAKPASTQSEFTATAPQDIPLPDEPVHDLLGYEPLKPTISGSPAPEPEAPAVEEGEEQAPGVPWYLQPVSKPDPGTALAPLTMGLGPQHITLRSPLGLIKRGPITAWLDVKGEIENFVQQLVADNEQ